MIVFFILAIVLKITIILFSLPYSNFDLQSYQIIGQAILNKQDIYQNIAQNHYPYLPFYLYLEAGAIRLSQLFPLPSSFFLKIINLFFDLGVSLLIYKLTKKNLNSFIFYLFSPITNLIFYFHGQFDIIPIFFILLSLYFLKIKKPIASVFTYSFAILTKPWPIFFFLPFFKKIKRKIESTFFLLIPILFFTVLYQKFFSSSAFSIFKTIINYRSLFNFWGLGKIINSVFFFTQEQPPIFVQKIFLSLFLIVFLIYSFFQSQKKLETAVFKLIIFFYVFTFGFSIQYLSWFMPFLIIVKPKYWQKIYFFISSYLIFSYWIWFNKNPFILKITHLLNFLSWFFLLILMLYWQKKGFKKN